MEKLIIWLDALHWPLMAGVGFTLLYAIGSLVQAVRLRSVRMSWSRGLWSPVPIRSVGVLFAGLSVALAFWISGGERLATEAIAAGWMGLNGFVAICFTGRTYITDSGVVKDLHRPYRTVAWYQIVDYLHSEGEEWIFLYQVTTMNGSGGMVYRRLTLQIPEEKKEAFKKIVSSKVAVDLDLPARSRRSDRLPDEEHQGGETQ
ncbi:MAG: hypothetical protein ACQER4_08300 [Bacteroidota bacterium]